MLKNKIFSIRKFVMILGLLAVLWICSLYAQAEYLTYQYGHIFADGFRQTNIISEPDYHKVLKYNHSSAVVLYVGGQSIDKIIFNRCNLGASNWTLGGWSTISSKSGSASGISWPPYF